MGTVTSGPPEGVGHSLPKGGGGSREDGASWCIQHRAISSSSSSPRKRDPYPLERTIVCYIDAAAVRHGRVKPGDDDRGWCARLCSFDFPIQFSNSHFQTATRIRSRAMREVS